MRFIVSVLATAAVARGQVSSTPGAGQQSKHPQSVTDQTNESAEARRVRARAEEFYSALLHRQYRQAEQLVAPDNRDLYYGMDKPRLEDVQIKNITISADGKAAELQIVATTEIRRPPAGAMKIPLPAVSHWKRIDGEWYWFMPVSNEQTSPFGVLHFSQPGDAPEANTKLSKAPWRAPEGPALEGSIKASSTNVPLGPEVGDTGTVTFQNTLRGDVILQLDIPKQTGYQAVLSTTRISPGQSALLTLKRVSDEKLPAQQITVNVSPIQQVIPILVVPRTVKR